MSVASNDTTDSPSTLFWTVIVVISRFFSAGFGVAAGVGTTGPKSRITGGGPILLPTTMTIPVAIPIQVVHDIAVLLTTPLRVRACCAGAGGSCSLDADDDPPRQADVTTRVTPLHCQQRIA